MKLRTPRAARLRLRGFLHRLCRIFSNVRVFLWLFTVTALIFDFGLFFDFGMFLTLVFVLTFFSTLFLFDFEASPLSVQTISLFSVIPFL